MKKLTLNKVHQWEQAVVALLNFEGWNLEWSGGGFEHYDARGKTPKGIDCIIEMKFRKTFYPEKLIEKYKFDKLLEDGRVALYFVNDPNGSFLYWLNDIIVKEPSEIYCPDTTLRTKKRFKKPCYLLKEQDAHIININIK